MSVLSHKSPPPPCAIVIFGANGDLTKRLIVPAMYNLARTGLLPPHFSLIGVDHNKKTSAEWSAALKDFLVQTLARNNETLDEALWAKVARCMVFLSGDFEKPETYKNLSDLLAEHDARDGLLVQHRRGDAWREAVGHPRSGGGRLGRGDRSGGEAQHRAKA